MSSLHVHWYQSLQILSSVGREAAGALGLWLALVDPPVSGWLVLLCQVGMLSREKSSTDTKLRTKGALWCIRAGGIAWPWLSIRGPLVYV